MRGNGSGHDFSVKMGDYVKTRRQTVFPPFPSVHRRCSGFCSGLDGGLTQIGKEGSRFKVQGWSDHEPLRVEQSSLRLAKELRVEGLGK